MLNQAQNNKTFGNCEATYRKELCLLFEKPYNFFHGANAQINFLTHFSSPVRFRLLFKDPVSPLHEERTFWISLLRENLWTATSKCWFISHWLTSLIIKTSTIWREQKLNNEKNWNKLWRNQFFEFNSTSMRFL